MTPAPTFIIADIRYYERPVTLRLPFRFGAVTVTHAPQAFVRVLLQFPDGRTSWGGAAELMVPKWFDKETVQTEAQSFDQLRTSLLRARDAYLGGRRPRTAFGHFAAHYPALVGDGPEAGLPALAACFGPAEIDKAVLDALARHLAVDFFTLVRGNGAGIAPADLLAEFSGFDFAAFAAGLAAPARLSVRHTVGMLDVLEGDPGDVGDGLPESLEQAIARYGLRYFKLKLGGDLEADVARLGAIAKVLDRKVPDYTVTLDGNEQYDDIDALATLWARVQTTPVLQALARRIAFIEQPINRRRALDSDVGVMAREIPIIIDESDGSLDAFARARACGYSGVSSKACKGLYKSLINRARVARWNAEVRAQRWFMSAEDLTTQGGLAVQQDLALAAALGITHVERNGHHYVNGFAGQHAPAAEQEAFLAAHPDLYERTAGCVRLRIAAGELRIGSLHSSGFASGAHPDWTALSPLRTTVTAIHERTP
ncbi:MAG: enolase C-terminal domain-like protein [Casimicrobiaceae bacterium]